MEETKALLELKNYLNHNLTHKSLDLNREN